MDLEEFSWHSVVALPEKSKGRIFLETRIKPNIGPQNLRFQRSSKNSNMAGVHSRLRHSPSQYWKLRVDAKCMAGLIPFVFVGREDM